jgi:hypothetical protein
VNSTTILMLSTAMQSEEWGSVLQLEGADCMGDGSGTSSSEEEPQGAQEVDYGPLHRAWASKSPLHRQGRGRGQVP